MEAGRHNDYRLLRVSGEDYDRRGNGNAFETSENMLTEEEMRNLIKHIYDDVHGLIKVAPLIAEMHLVNQLYNESKALADSLNNEIKPMI